MIKWVPEDDHISLIVLSLYLLKSFAEGIYFEAGLQTSGSVGVSLSFHFLPP